MGFFDTLGKAVAAGSAKLKETQEETNRIYEEYQTKSDSALRSLARGGSIARRMAAMKVLKERGYTSI